MSDKTHPFKWKTLPFTVLLVIGFSIFLPLCSQAAIVAGTASTGSMNNTNTANVSYTVASGNNSLLIVGISTQQPNNTVTSVSYGGTALTKISHVAHTSQTRVEFWYLLAPAVGTNTLSVSTSNSTNTVFGIQQFTGVDQGTPFGTFVSATGTSTTATVNASSASGELVFGTVGWNNGNTNAVGASQTEYWDLSMNSSISGAGSAEAGAATTTISWTNSGSQPWSIAAVPIKPAVSGMPGGVLTPSFWVMGNNGTSTTTNNTTLSTWSDQSGSGNNATAGTAPTFKDNATDNFNFNPVVTFNGSSQHLNIASNLGLTTTNVGTVFSVVRMASGASGTDMILGSQTNTTGAAQIYVNGAAPHSLVMHRIGGTSPTGLITSNSQISAITPTILGTRRNGSSVAFWFNGTNQTSGTPNMTAAWVNANRRLGATQGPGSYLAANMAETIVYGSSLADYQVQNIESYLAVKYGITLSHDYYASDWNGSAGTTFWNMTTNSGFNNNIAGIGRDDANGSANATLLQKQSRSINTSTSGDLVVMGLNAIATNNSSNAGSFSANRSFLMWGDNSGSIASWTSTESNSTLRTRLTREWKVQETGTVGSVVVRVQDNSASSGAELPAETTKVYLLVDADGDFTSGASEYLMTLSGSNWETTLDFTTGQYFTFATDVLQTPGGTTLPAIWLKADAGVTTGATFTWADQSGNSHNATQSTSGNQPTLTATSFNYNPAVTFDGTNDYLSIANYSTLPGGNAAVEAFSVANNNNTSGNWQHIIAYGTGNTGQMFSIGKNTGNANANTALYTYDAISSALEFTGGVPVLIDGKYTGSQAITSTFGVQRATLTATGSKVLSAGYIGVDAALALSTCWNGNIPEVILYGTNLSTTDVQKVNSYLALKYGITLDQTTATNYLASDATIIWNASTNSGYKNNIAGIGRDDISALYQKQSRSINTSSYGNLVAVGLGNVATNNAANSNTFSADKSFLVWGDDNGSTNKTTTNVPAGTCGRMTRIWKVQETGTEVGNVEVRLDLSSLSSVYGSHTAAQLRLAVASNSTFSSGVRTYTASSYSSGVAIFSSVDLDNGEFFTLGFLDPNFNPTISSNSPVCEGGELNLFASGGTSYTWSGPFGFSSNLQNPEVGYATFSHDGTYSVTISNSFNCSAVLTVVVEVNSCNPNTCQYDVCNNTTVSGSITGTDADGDALTYTTFQSPAHGTLSIVGNNFTYDPADNYVGEDQFTIRTCDPSGACVDCVKKFVVTECGAVPVCGTSSTLTTCMGVTGSGTLNATDPSGGSITYAIVSQPSGGAVSLVGANYTFTPSSGFEGATTWVYSATNANGSIECTVTAFAENCFSTCDGGGCGSTNLITGGTYYTSGSNVFCQSGISVSTNTEYCFKANLTDNCSTCDSTAKVFFTINSIQIGQIYNADLPSATASTQGFSFNTGDISNPSTITVCITHVNFGTPGTHIVAASPELRSVGNILPSANDDSGISICKNSGAYTTAVLENDVNVLSTATLSITSSMPGATGTVSISGKNVVFTPSSTFVGTTTITYQICNGTCCDAADLSVEVVEPTISLPTTPICGATSTVLTATVGGISSSLANFQWQSSSNNSAWANISNATATSYSVSTLSSTTYFRIVMTPLSANCSVLASSSEVVSPNFPTAAAGSNTPICIGGTAQFAGSASGGQSPYTWAWSGAASFSSAAQNPTRSNATLAMAGNYTLTVTDAFGCTGSQTTVLAVNSDPSATVNVPTNTVCVGGNVTLTATASGGAGTCGFQWQSSPNGTYWTDISGETNSSFTTPNLSSQTRYRVIYSCSGEGCCN